MNDFNRKTTSPLAVRRSNRNHAIQVLTSMPAGKSVPLAAIPMLREDALNAAVDITVEMGETRELLMNPVNLRVTAYVVPYLAFERFNGSRDELDRSYMKEASLAGPVLPFFETMAAPAHGGWLIHKYLGLHHKPGAMVNTAYLEAYNTIYNHRAKMRSPDLTPRLRLQSNLAPAFWQNSRFAHVVPDFDQAVIDGEVALNLVNSRAPVRGLYKGAVSGVAGVPYTSTPGGNRAAAEVSQALIATSGAGIGVGGTNEVWAEMQANGFTVSLSNIDQARKMQSFAKLRERFAGHDDEYIVDMLMDGLSIPDQSLKQPILIADQTTRFAQAKRYATDSGNLADSAVSGAAVMSLRLRVPKLNTGGIVMVMAEAVPEQLFERQRDALLFTVDPFGLPEYLRDTLDPEQVDYLRNDEVDTAHATPAGTFGYVPLNWKWTSAGPRVGGKFYRPETNSGTDAERQRIWAIEKVNPLLTEDFFLVSDPHNKPFLNTAADPFEATAVGGAVINGNTVFGAVLLENTNSYDEVKEERPAIPRLASNE